jgi:hypothetical protein
MQSPKPSNFSVSEAYDRFLEGLASTSLKNANVIGATKLERLAASAPKEIPDWFDAFVSQPAMPKQPDVQSLPPYLRKAARLWMENPAAEPLIDVNRLEDSDKESFKKFQSAWQKYFDEEQKAFGYISMVRYFQWRIFFARQLLHHVNNAGGFTGTVSDKYNKLLEALHTGSIKNAKLIGLSKLEELAVSAPDLIPDWFDVFMGDPPTHEKPTEGEDKLPPYLMAIVKSWHHGSLPEESELSESLFQAYSADDQLILKQCLKKWRDYWEELALIEIHFSMIRYFEWRVFYGWQLLHQINQL